MYLIALLILVGVTGFMLIEHYGFLDSLYLTMITISTIGYGEIHPLTTGGGFLIFFLLLQVSLLPHLLLPCLPVML
jgi:voltage-gated potassium channel